MQQQKLYIFIGYPGAGKTTVAKIIADTTGAVHLWADHERQHMFNDVNHSKNESKQLYTSLNNRTAQLLQAGKSVIFDTNFNYRKDRDHLRSIAKANRAKAIVIWLTTPLPIARKRALHDTHRNRNRYEHVMLPATFDTLVDHLETPSDNEKFITIDGSNIDIANVKRQLDI